MLKKGLLGLSLVGVAAFSFQNCTRLTVSSQVLASAGTSYCVGRESEAACKLSAPAPVCRFNGQTLATGTFVTAYLNSAAPSCTFQTRTCQAGALSGSYDFASCQSPGTDQMACLFNGVTVASGSSVVAYLNSNGTCTSQNRVCANGVLSGSYAYGSCSDSAPASCLFNGVTINHGQSVFAYLTSTSRSGQSCDQQIRTCYNGALSGTGDYASCTKDEAACQLDGRTIPSGGSVIAYDVSRVAYGSTCEGKTRTCTNGVLSGTSPYGSCAVDQPASCLINGKTVVSGSAINLYVSASVPSDQLCQVELRQCQNGSLSGSATFESCTVQPPPWMEKPAFHSYYYAPKIIREMVSAGVDTFSVDTNLFGDDSGLSGGPVAPAGGVWDFSALKNIIQQIKNEKPKARFILRVYAGAPDWWKVQLPDELDQYADGCREMDTKLNSQGQCVRADGNLPNSQQQIRHISRGSPLMMSYWVAGLSQLQSALSGIQALDQVDSVVITGLSSQEWIAWDSNFTSSAVRPMIYGTGYRQRYQQWHAQRYGIALDVPSEAEFENYKNPLGSSAFVDLASSANVVHYFQYRNELTPKIIGELAKNVKTYFPSAKIGAIYGYMNEMGGEPSFGHNGLRTLLDSPDIDFINPMSSYQDRVLKGADFERQPVTSLAVNGKQILNDLDQGTHVSKENYDGNCAVYGGSGDPHLLEVYRVNCNSGDPGSLYNYALTTLGFRTDPATNLLIPPSLFDDISNFRRYLGYALARNIKFNFLSLHNDTTAGAERSYLSENTLLSSVVPQIVQVKKASTKFNLNSAAEVLVISDEDSNNFVRHWAITPYMPDRSMDIGGINYHALATSRIGLNKMGAPYDHILLSDLPRIDVTKYKLIIFLNSWSVDSNTRALITQKLQNNNRVLVWNHGSGLFQNGVRDLQNISSLVGMNIVNGASIKNPSIAINPAIYPLFTKAFVVSPKYPADCCDLLYAADGNAAALGTYEGTNFTSMAIRHFGTWKSIWAATLTLPGDVWRDIARSAGVHIYNEATEPFYANQSYLTVVANSGGGRVLSFKSPVNLYEGVGNSLLATKVMQYSFSVSEGGVYLFRKETP